MASQCAICAYVGELGRWSSARQFLEHMRSSGEDAEAVRVRWALAADDPIMAAVREALESEEGDVADAGEYTYHARQMAIKPWFEEVLAVDGHDLAACAEDDGEAP